MFVFGSDTDDIQTIRNTQRYAKKLDIDSIQFMMLTPLPGTPVFEELKRQGRLIHTDWSKYDAHHVVFEPKLMTPFELHVETLKAMAKFYSWLTILRNLGRFDFFYGIVGLYGKRAVKKSLSNRKQYLEYIKELVITEFDRKTDRLRKYFSQKQKEGKSIILNIAPLEKVESKFFSTFIRKLGKELVIARDQITIHGDALTITPLVERIKSSPQEGIEYVKDLYERHRDRLNSIKVINIDSISLFKTCVNIGLLLNVNFKKVRKAYEKALKEIGGTAFECNAIMITVDRS
jgi:hypothetical protein